MRDDIVCRDAFVENALQSSTPFGTWGIASLRRLTSQARLLQFARGATVVDRGQVLDCVYVVGSGGVQTQVTGSDGRQLTLRYGEQGRTFGLLGFVDQKGAPHEILAIVPTCIVTIPFQAIREIVALDPSLWFSVAQELAARFRRQIEMTEERRSSPPASDWRVSCSTWCNSMARKIRQAPSFDCGCRRRGWAICSAFRDRPSQRICVSLFNRAS